MTQCEMILDYIFEEGSISPLEAVRDLGCFSLAARVKDLRRSGYKINVLHETRSNRYGKSCTFSRYYMDKEDLDRRETVR